MRCLGEAIAWDGWADDLKHHILIQALPSWVREQWDDFIELVEGAGPAMHHQQRPGCLTVGDTRGLHVDKMDFNPCQKAKRNKLMLQMLLSSWL